MHLTPRTMDTIMKVPGNRDRRVTIKPLRQDGYDRIRPQGARRFRAHQSLGREYRRNARERDVGPGRLSERRSGAGGADPLLEGVAQGSRETRGVRRLSVDAPQALLNDPFHLEIPPARWRSACLVLFLTSILLSGCGGHKQTRVQSPPPPPIPQDEPAPVPAPAETPTEDEKIEVRSGAKPIFEETGMASWYGAPYHNRRGSNGEVYNMHAMTAAHRTLPLGSIVRVTNVKTGHSAVVRITDRGPFVEGRIIDLSKAAAQKIGLVQKGTAPVRLEVLKTPQPIEAGGRWAVQIGAFQREESARDLAGHLSRRYHTAKVLAFNSPIGDWWVRVRVKDDLRARAEEVMRGARTGEGAVFLVRLD